MNTKGALKCIYNQIKVVYAKMKLNSAKNIYKLNTYLSTDFNE